METATPIAEGLRTTDGNAQYDAACKRLLAFKIILAWIMKSCLEEYKNCDVNEIAENYIEGEPVISKAAVMPDETNANRKIHGIGTEDSTLTEGRITYDIRFIAVVPGTGELIRLIINLEAQGEFFLGYPVMKRVVYYGCRLISSQYGTEFTHSDYQNIKKVYSIWIVLRPPKNRQNTITRYRIVEENIVGNVKEPIENYDLMTLLMICLGEPENAECDILKLLDVLLSNGIEAAVKKKVLEDEFDIPMTEKMKGEFQGMGGIGDMIEREALAKGRAEGRTTGRAEGRTTGRAEGRTTGRAEGRAEGIMETTLNSIRSLMETLNLTIEQAMNALKVPDGERRTYANLLANQ